MRKGLGFTLVVGLGGALILAGLGFWQVARLGEKRQLLERIEAQIAAAPVALPDEVSALEHRYLPVRLWGRFTGEALYVLSGAGAQGSGGAARVIAAFESVPEGRRVMVDRGITALAGLDALRLEPHTGPMVEVIGNLYWPDEQDRFTPPPDLEKNLWFAREVGALARGLRSEPVLVVARAPTGGDAPITPIPVDSSSIANNHLGYAIQWFGLAAVWLGMTAYFFWRKRQS